MTAFGVTAQTESSAGSQITVPAAIDSTTVLNEIKISRELQKKNPEDSNDYVHAKNAINYALVLKDTLLYARALDNLGLLYRYNQEYSQSLDLHIKAFDLVKNMNVAPIFKMIFANNAGVSARYFEKYDLAVQYYLDALKIAEKENDLKNIAISSNGLGNTLGNIPERQDESLAYFNRALQAEKSRNNPRGMAMNFLSIGDYYIQKKEYKIARDYLKKLKDLNRTNKDKHGLAITDEFYGISYLEEGKELDRALSYFKTSLHRFEEVNDLQKQAEILSQIGSVYEKLGETGDALINYDRSMSLAKTINSKGLILSNAENIGSIYEKRNDFEKALQYYKLSHLYRDSIDLFQQKIQIAALTNNYEIVKKESRIKILENEKRLRQEQLSSQKEKTKRQGVLFLLIGIVILAVLAISIMQNRNIKLKKKSELLFAANEKERLKALYERDLAQAQMQASRLQLNPHFLFNCLNGINFLIQKEENEKAANYLIVFSRFLRLVLETSKSPVISLEEELAMIRHYLMLESNRFDGNFSYRLSVENEEKTKHVMIPSLLLQPYVENAILHGLLPSEKEKKELNINVSFNDGETAIIIEDNGVGKVEDESRKDNSHQSMGTKITQERINLFNKNYDGHISCETVNRTCLNRFQTGTSVIIKLTNN
jgi:tetratricopeptide (TPR) repeat protein